MEPIPYIDRITGKHEREDVYGGKALKFLYGDDLLSRIFSPPLLYLLCRFSLFSAFYGWWQKQSFTKGKIIPFIRHYQINASEFLLKPHQFSSFNDFFIRKLKPDARPMTTGAEIAIIPADGRYYFYENIALADGFNVKNKKFNLASLLQSEELANNYQNGTMIMARLCPTDYHRFHFCCNCVPGKTKNISGFLYSVNPIAIKKNIHIFTENKRALTELQTDLFGNVLFLEIGATNVGSIHQTYPPNQKQKKGDEKGYFSFGGSALILLFQQGRLQLDKDLLEATRSGLEIRCLMGQSMGQALQ